MKKEIISGVYFIRNEVNQKIYIGSSKDILNRWYQHKFYLKTNKHPNCKLQNAVNKYGLVNFKLEVIEKTKQYLTREQYYIDKYNAENIYNLSLKVNTGGANVLEKEVLLLDLKGNVIDSFESGSKCANFLKLRILPYTYINTNRVCSRKYRIVTPEFYNSNFKLIKTWKKYTEKAEYKRRILKSKIYTLFYTDNKKVQYFKTMEDVGKFLGVSKEAVRLCLLNGGYYKRLKLYISKGCLLCN